MRFETLSARTDERGVVYLDLNLPEKRNAISALMIDELTTFSATTGSEAETRVVVLAGAGKVFCAGGDLEWMKTQIEADRATRINEARKLAAMLQALNEMPSPLIARIHGAALGGGVGMACVCDVAIAERSTTFGFTETRLGLIPATIGPYVIARMGEGRARQVFMSARLFNADEAVRLGVVSQALDAKDMDAAIEAEIAPYLSVAPHAVGAAKALARSLGPKINAQVIDDTICRLADIWEGEEAAHGIDAFLNKERARWTD